MVEQNFWEMLRAKHDSLTKSGTIVADYLVQHAEDAQYLSISSLAKACGVAEATNFRFCRSLGFDGYNEMKIALAQGLAVGLEFKLCSEILKTVIVRDWKEIITVAGIIGLRAALTFLIHWEIKEEKNHS